MNFAKRRLNGGDGSDTPVGSLFSDSTISTLGLGSLGLGVFDSMMKKKKAQAITEHVETNFAYKDSVLNLIVKEINDIRFTNKSLERVVERVEELNTTLCNTLQEKIY